MSVRAPSLREHGLNAMNRLMYLMCKADYLASQPIHQTLADEALFNQLTERIQSWVASEPNKYASRDIIQAQIVIKMVNRRLQEWVSISTNPSIDRQTFVQPFTPQDQIAIIDLQTRYHNRFYTYASVLQRDFLALQSNETGRTHSHLFQEWHVPDILILSDLGLMSQDEIAQQRVYAGQRIERMFPHRFIPPPPPILDTPIPEHRLIAERAKKASDRLMHLMCIADYNITHGNPPLPDHTEFDQRKNEVQALVDLLNETRPNINDNKNVIQIVVTNILARRRIAEWNHIAGNPGIDRTTYIELFTPEDQNKLVRLQEKNRRNLFRRNGSRFSKVLKRDYQALEISPQPPQHMMMFQIWYVPSPSILAELNILPQQEVNIRTDQEIRDFIHGRIHILTDLFPPAPPPGMRTRKPISPRRSDSVTDGYTCAFCADEHDGTVERYKCPTCHKNSCISGFNTWDTMLFNKRKRLTCPFCRTVHPRRVEPSYFEED